MKGGQKGVVGNKGSGGMWGQAGCNMVVGYGGRRQVDNRICWGLAEPAEESKKSVWIDPEEQNKNHIDRTIRRAAYGEKENVVTTGLARTKP